MKTTDLNLRKISGSISALVILLASFFFLTGCEKDDMTSMNNEENHSSTEKHRATINQSEVFTMLVIDHTSAHSNIPNYKVELKSDGSVIFTGRKNTAIIGHQETKVSMDIVHILSNMFIANKFADINDNLPFYADLSSTTTIFRSSMQSDYIKKTDYNGNELQQLIDLRTKAEEILMVSTFIFSRKNLNEPQVNMGQKQD